LQSIGESPIKKKRLGRVSTVQGKWKGFVGSDTTNRHLLV
jgi:hypothetical protein